MPIKYVQIKPNFYFLAGITLILVIDKSYFSVFGILFALLHELGHIFVILTKKNNINKINFGIVNIDMIYENNNFCDYKDELCIFSAGCIVNFVLYLIFILIYFAYNIYFFKIVAYQNLLICVINLLPIESLDGHKILNIILSKKLDLIKRDKILNIISIIFLIPVCILGFTILIKSKYNYSLLVLGLYLFSNLIYKILILKNRM